MKNRHILVTGIHRSGTTFVGKMLGQAPGVGYVQEPFNPDLGITGIDCWYKYIKTGISQEAEYTRLIENLLAGKAKYKERPGTHGGFLRTAGRKLFSSRDYLQYLLSAHLPGSNRLLLKDPLAALSSKWLHDRFNVQVIAMLRHPAGFAASAARLGWDYNFFSFITSQKPLMDDFLGELLDPFDIPTLKQHEGAALLWRCIYTILDDFSRQCEDFKMVKLEDISSFPIEHFKEINQFLELPFTAKQQKAIIESTDSRNPVSAPEGKAHSLRRNRKGISSYWSEFYSRQEIERIMELAGPPAQKYYPNNH